LGLPAKSHGLSQAGLELASTESFGSFQPLRKLELPQAKSKPQLLGQAGWNITN